MLDRETLERINVRFHDNGTMSYNERRTHVFEPTLSGGGEDDVLVVPNLPFLVSFNWGPNYGARFRHFAEMLSGRHRQPC